MRFILVVSLWFWAQVSVAQDADIQSVITAQIEAFEQGDFEAAFSHASPSIQNYFGGADRFEAMVRSGYEMVIMPRDVRFLEMRNLDGKLWQKVLIQDSDNVFHLLEYQMISHDGQWRINGVRFVQAGAAA
ncbi:hypothetical protein NBRC116601_01380 [Cognatishimia sp. WU-CL00825]|uniref:DUF4864 domain-containing protein n=1 Tax=Cognatishimia sp. WU-CL00825 TaxID=3127658 RepID=UPI003107475C